MDEVVKYLAPVNDIKEMDEAELDNALLEIKQHSRRAAAEVYKLGGVLRRVRDDGLWLLRINKVNGKQKYTGFWEFCRAEIAITESYIRRLIGIHEEFEMRDVKKFGVTRLSVSMQLPEPKRKAFFERSKYVSTASPQFRDIVRTMKAEPIVEKVYGDPAKTVAVDLPLGVRIETMWKRSNVGSRVIGKPTTPALNLADDPWAKFKLSNLVTAYIRLTRNDRGEIMAALEFRHGTETPASREGNEDEDDAR